VACLCRHRVVSALAASVLSIETVRYLYTDVAKDMNGTVEEQLGSLEDDEASLEQCAIKIVFFEHCKARLESTTASQVRFAAALSYHDHYVLCGFQVTQAKVWAAWSSAGPGDGKT
jgi:hypothetical protein